MSRKNKKKIPAPVVSRKEKWITRVIIAASLLFGIIGGFSAISFIGSNNLHSSVIYFALGIAGIVIAYYCSIQLEKKFPLIAYKEKGTDNIVSAGLLIGFTFSLPTAVNYYNHNTVHQVKCNSYSILRKETSPTRSGGKAHYIYVTHNNKEVELLLYPDKWDKLIAGGNVELCIATGGLGLDFVKEVNLVNTTTAEHN